MNNLRTLNPEQVASFLRTLIQGASAMVLGNAWTSSSWGQGGISIVVFAGVTIWGVWARSDTNLIASAANVPAVKTIRAEPEVANAVPASNVVPG